MKFEDRKQLEMLSVKAFGKPHAYNKLYKRGYPAEMTEKLKDGTERKYKGVKYQTLAEIETVMHELIAKKEQEEAEKKAKELNEILADPNVKSVDPQTGLTLDETRREGTYE